jgi:hypothetical protein
MGFWGSPGGAAVLEKEFSTTKIRVKFFQSRPPCGAPDIDGGRCREHWLPMFMNDDKELHELIRTELILPFVFGDFHPQDLNEHFGDLLFAFLKADGVGLRPVNRSTGTRRCASSLKLQTVRRWLTRRSLSSCDVHTVTVCTRARCQCSMASRGGSTRH